MKCLQCSDFRRKCTEEASLEGKEIKSVVVLTIAFLFIFTAFNALQNLHSSLHDEESLGLICMSIIYGTAIMSSVFAPTIIGLLGAKAVLVTSFGSHCVYVLANFYPSFSTMCPAAFALGLFNGPAWTSQALYISASAFSYSKTSSTSPYKILSHFNGLFFALFATTQIPGNLVTSTVIRHSIANKTEEMVVFQYCGPLDCPYNENATQIEDPESWVIDITLGFFMACALLGLLLVFLFLTPLPTSSWYGNVGVRETAFSCLSVFISPNMILLVPFIMFTAVEHAFLLSSFTKAYVSCPIGIHMVGFVMACYGATTPVFMFLFLRLARVTGRYILLTLSLVTHIILLVVLFIWSPTADDEVFIFLIPMIWGVAESILQAQANALIAMLYPSKKEPAYANFHAWRSLGYTITFVDATYLCVSTKLILCMALCSAGLLFYSALEFKLKMEERLALKRRSSKTPETQGEVEAVDGGKLVSVAAKLSSVSSVQSEQDRLCFNRIELADIIKEAQGGWRRDEGGLVLELDKVMCKSNLIKSKVTNWYHIHPEFAENNNNTYSYQSDKPAGLPRSKSDGHLVSAGSRQGVAYRRDYTPPLVSDSGDGFRRRPLSENLSSTFDNISEVNSGDVFEDDDEIVMGERSNGELDGTDTENKNTSNGVITDSDILEESEKPVKKVHFMRRLSNYLLALDEENSDDDQPIEILLMSSIQQSIPPRDLSGGHEPVSEKGSGLRSPKRQLSEGGAKTQSPDVSVLYKPGAQYSRSVSLNLEEKTSKAKEKRLKLKMPKNLQAQTSPTSTPTKTPDGKSKPFSFKGFKGLKKSKKNLQDFSFVNVIDENGVNVNGRKEAEPDSDGFVDDDDDIMDDTWISEPMRRLSMIPISVDEDVNCIY